MADLTKLSVVIADDHPMLLQGLKNTLISGGVKVMAAASDGTTALQAIQDHVPDLAILDIEMPYLTGFAIAEECRNRGLKTKFIILSYHKEAAFIAQAQNSGVSGYLLKEDTSLEIFNCILAVMDGRAYYSQSLVNKELNFANENLKRLASLSPSEKKILKMIATQLSSQEIANKLHVSERTIEKHRSNIISKLNLSGQANSLSLWSLENKSIIMNL